MAVPKQKKPRYRFERHPLDACYVYQGQPHSFEALCRLNFLFNLAEQAVLKAHRSDNDDEKDSWHDFCRHYVKTAREIAAKLVIRLHPDVKHTFCKSCNIFLKPGATQSFRLIKVNKKCHYLEKKCLGCQKTKRSMVNRSKLDPKGTNQE